MTARKTTNTAKPKQRKGSGPTMATRMETAEAFMGAHSEAINQLHQRIAAVEGRTSVDPTPAIAECMRRLDALESRDRLRDKSHDAPVSNAGEAIGQHYRLIREVKRPWWRRFLSFMGGNA